MPYGSNDELPSRVKNNLPSSAQTMYRKVFNAAYEGTCAKRKDRDACAAKIAWSQVTKKYTKSEDGKYHAKAELSDFSMAITDVTHNKQAGTFRWKAVASDVYEDSYKDNMTHELYSDFLARIESNELVPEAFRSDYWSGGIPYLSVSHYPDLNGKAVPGPTRRVYVDGDCFKADGEFDLTPLGMKCYNAIRKDLYEEPKPENPVRVSIAFLDWMHRHKSDGSVFERKSEDDICPQCVVEKLFGTYEGVEYLRGHLVHLALTRVPVNPRTEMEVSRAMTTRKEDAESIIEELAEEIDKEASLVGKSDALVVKAEDKKKDEEDMEDEEDCSKKKKSEADAPAWLSSLEDRLSQIEASLHKEPVEVELQETVSHPLDGTFAAFKSAFDAIQQLSLPDNDKLIQLQEPMNAIGNAVRSLITVKAEPEPEEELPEGENVELVKALSRAISESFRPISDKMDLVLDNLTKQPPVEIPARRSIAPTLQMQSDIHTPVVKQDPNKPADLRTFVRRSVGLSQ